MDRTGLFGHLAAAACVLVWGVTFISTKILLGSMTPLEILFYRFLLGWLALWLICPMRLSFDNASREKLFALAGFFGVTLYFLLENLSLEWTLASNASVIVSTAPFFTALAAWLIGGDKRPPLNFYVGFVLAIIGIMLISFAGNPLQVNPWGDFLALLAAIAWGFYSIITRRLAISGLGALVTTRRIFFYGLVFILPCFCFWPLQAGLDIFTDPLCWGNLAFLGIGASALCFAAWTYALAKIGTLNASAYIYLVPVISVLCAHFILDENLTAASLCGCMLTIAGLMASEDRLWDQGKKLLVQYMGRKG